MNFKENIHQLLTQLDSPTAKLDCLLPLLSPQHFEVHYPFMTETERKMVEVLYTASLRLREEAEAMQASY